MPSAPRFPWRLVVPLAAAFASVPFILPLTLPLLLRSTASPRTLSLNRLTWLPSSPAIRTAPTVSPPLAPSPSPPSAPSPPVTQQTSPSPPPPPPPPSPSPPSAPLTIQAPHSPPPPPPPIQAPHSPPSPPKQTPHPPPPPHSPSRPPPASTAAGEKAGGTETRGRCDVYDGEWVQDEEARPLYPPGTCPYVDEAYACAANGRPDSRYTRWRWAPRHCRLPRFNATDFLERLRGKRLLLVGDSMNRNQFESMLCVLREALPDKARMFETHGYRISKGRGYFVFKFADYGCTVEFVRSHFLVREGVRYNRQGNSNPILQIDRIDKTANRWKKADVLVFNTGHWWTHGKTARGYARLFAGRTTTRKATRCTLGSTRLKLTEEPSRHGLAGSTGTWIRPEASSSTEDTPLRISGEATGIRAARATARRSRR
ncbi:hypothetical protein BDA96_10G280500 [Sorghum bicolor]|uniref:Trichome birefringence-like N-terminal domain-containing protein n=1 Tax=Sorghum bicolor TaxID=4558 RepID=A0A921Q4M3_SORBI|nr:hypothetical protein BDA96_10G280500 [Sorghum bicolor]